MGAHGHRSPEGPRPRGQERGNMALGRDLRGLRERQRPGLIREDGPPVRGRRDGPEPLGVGA